MSPRVRRLTTLLLLGAAALTLAGCATSAEDTWIHPDTGAVPAPPTPDGG